MFSPEAKYLLGLKSHLKRMGQQEAEAEQTTCVREAGVLSCQKLRLGGRSMRDMP